MAIKPNDNKSAEMDRTNLARKAFCGVLPLLWDKIKAKIGRPHGVFMPEDADNGLAMMTDAEIGECMPLNHPAG